MRDNTARQSQESLDSGDRDSGSLDSGQQSEDSLHISHGSLGTVDIVNRVSRKYKLTATDI